GGLLDEFRPSGQDVEQRRAGLRVPVTCGGQHDEAAAYGEGVQGRGDWGVGEYGGEKFQRSGAGAQVLTDEVFAEPVRPQRGKRRGIGYRVEPVVQVEYAAG